MLQGEGILQDVGVGNVGISLTFHRVGNGSDC